MDRTTPRAAAVLGCAAVIGSQLAQPLFVPGPNVGAPLRGCGALHAGSADTGAGTPGGASSRVAGLTVATSTLIGAAAAAGARKQAVQRHAAKKTTRLQRDMSKVRPEDDIFEDEVKDVGTLGERTSLFGGTKDGPTRVIEVMPDLYAKAPARPEGPWVVEDQIGAIPPLGFFDPLGFTKDIDKAGFRKYRAAELKHGRVAMVALGGAIMQSVHRIPGFEEMPAGIWAPFSPPATYGLLAMVALNGVFELFLWRDKPYRQPGDFEDPLQFGILVPSDDGAFGSRDFRERELSNGRFAMFAILGVIAAELATGKNAIQQLGVELPRLIMPR
mmetsp:Transcript_89438/g.193608  ORF Transcript_89438/g.193608 Transcript_89438/m.193608 type:complete len:330 (-) Transcript_89438:35-1024(-)